MAASLVGGFSVPSKTLLFLRVSGSRSVSGRGGPVLPCPSRGLLWSGGHAGHPAPGTRRPGAGQPASAWPSLPVGGIPRPRRASPGVEQSVAGRGAGRGTPRCPAAPGAAGDELRCPTSGNASAAPYGCAAAARLSSFLSFPFKKAPTRLGREQVEDAMLAAQRQVAISRDTWRLQ